MNQASSYRFDPIVPMNLPTTTPEELRAIREKFGLRRFFLNAPSLEVELTGYPGLSCYTRIGEEILRFKEALKDTDIEINWWCAPSIRCGGGAPYQYIVNFDGRETATALCPADPGFTADFAAKVAEVAKVAHPAIIHFEDDLELSNQPPVVKFGCFCPRHLDLFAKKAGRFYSREELVKIFREDLPETLPLRRLWGENSRKTMCSFASAIRKAVDSVAPETRLTVCEPGTDDADGFFAIEEALAFAGTHTRPLIRIYGSAYSCNDAPRDIPWLLAHTMYTAERIPQGMEWMHESDTYPHTAFFMSPAFLETLISGALAMGADNSQFYGSQYTDNPGEEEGYFAMYKRNAGRFEAMRQACNGGTLTGCRVIHLPEVAGVKKLAVCKGPRYGNGVLEGNFQFVSYMLGIIGIPCSTANGTPAFLAGQEADVLSDAEIRNLLSSGVMLDGAAAMILDRRGYGELLGVETKELDTLRFCAEKIEEIPEFSAIRGKNIYNLAYAPAGSEGGIGFVNLLPRPGAKILSYYTAPDGSKVQPGMVRFTNALGGKVCIFASKLWGNNSSNIYCYRKQEMFRTMLEWLAGKPLPAAAAQEAALWLLVRKKPEATLFFVTNLSSSPRQGVRLHLAPEYQQGKWEELDDEGLWQPFRPVHEKETIFHFPGEFRTLRMRIFRRNQSKEN